MELIIINRLGKIRGADVHYFSVMKMLCCRDVVLCRSVLGRGAASLIRIFCYLPEMCVAITI